MNRVEKACSGTLVSVSGTFSFSEWITALVQLRNPENDHRVDLRKSRNA